jgi:hypothetical protein
MALLVDGNISAVGDLQSYDTGVLEAARGESIDLEQKLRLGEQEITIHVATFLLRQRGRVPVRHNGEPDLSGVVVTAGLRRWHVLRTLALVYGDAYGSQLNDRYQKKRDYFERQAKEAEESYVDAGVGFVNDPIGRARQPQVTVGGAGPAAATYAVSVAWRSFRGERGEGSIPLVLKTENGQGWQVTGTYPPSNAESFDVYAGESESIMTQQNVAPVQVGGVWVLPADGLVTGPTPGDGQDVDYWIRHERVMRRG